MKKIYLLLCLSGIITLSEGRETPGFYNVRLFGAKGDGKTLDSPAINKAIEAASNEGGGTVFIPAGNYLSGSIRLKSHTTLFLDQGSTIIATTENPGANYDQAENLVANKFQDYGHSNFHNSLIWGDSIHDISIIGPGKIWGKGLLKDWKKDSKEADKAITLYRCRNVIMHDFTILHGGWFAILATGVDNLTIDNLKLDTNRDGMDIDCCRNVRVSNCFVNTPYDDGICLKSTFALNQFRATENVTITNCQLSGYDEGTFLNGTFKRTENAEYKFHPTGRIKFGTESNGGFKNITISNCVFDYCRGLALETVDGGLIEDVTITNITMRDVVNDPIFLRIGARMRGPEKTPVGTIKRIIISNVVVYNADPWYTCTLSGIPGHAIEDVTLRDIKVYYKGGGTKEQAQRDIPENEKNYPEPGMLGAAPAYGLFVRHAKNITLDNIELHVANPDYRPAMRFDDVKGIQLWKITTDKTPGAGTLALREVTNFVSWQSLSIADQKLESVNEKVIE